VDISGHGTHTLGIILGNNVGVAPDADWIGCTNLARNQGNPGFYLTCMQFLFAPYGQSENPFTDGQPLSGAEVFNNSWGCPESEGCDNFVMSDAALALRTAGVYVAVSAGNSGFSGCGSISEPLAIFEDVFSVGAVDSKGQVAEFSSLGPVVVDGSNRLKPDLAAPGVDILSAYPQGAYEVFSGTSMAGPHVAGTVALMWSANPDLIGQIDLTDKILRETARPYEGILPECVGQSLPNEAVGYGILDAYAAVKQALEIR
jgi:subtilisin family serine protease